MSINKPYHRNYRPVKQNHQNHGYSDWAYVIDKQYSISPEHYTRAFLIIQNDLLKLFEFVEPADRNYETYSFRIHELFTRICIEIESNFKAILKENIFSPVFKKEPDVGKVRGESRWNINDFKLINKTHHLDDYEIEFPIWQGNINKRKPFENWKNGGDLVWYQAYNSSKHDRLSSFEKANFNNLIDAFSGLCVLLSSQFRHVDFHFQPGPDYIEAHGYSYYGGGFGIGKYVIVDYPDNWNDDELYDFDWTNLESEKVKFQKFDYNQY